MRRAINQCAAQTEMLAVSYEEPMSLQNFETSIPMRRATRRKITKNLLCHSRISPYHKVLQRITKYDFALQSVFPQHKIFFGAKNYDSIPQQASYLQQRTLRGREVVFHTTKYGAIPVLEGSTRYNKVVLCIDRHSYIPQSKVIT